MTRAESGYEVENPHTYAKGLYKVLNMAMNAGLDLDAVEPEVEYEETVADDADAEEAGEDAAESVENDEL